jgi:hypothetical protein
MFVGMLEAVERATSGERSPETIKAASEADPNFEVFCRSLDELGRAIHERLLTGRRKFLRGCDVRFREAWDRYNAKWKDVSDDLLDFSGLTFPSTDDASDEPAVRNFLWDWSEFKPEDKNASELVEEAIEYLRIRADDPYTGFFKEALRAFEWFENTLGLNFETLERRWHVIEAPFLPPGISNRYGDTERRTLFRYIEEVHSCYVHGNALAGLLLARALLERVLKEHYLPRARPDLVGKKIGIEQLINECAAVFNVLDRTSFDALRVTANSVAHSFSELELGNMLDFRGNDDVALRNAISILRKFLEIDPIRTTS